MVGGGWHASSRHPRHIAPHAGRSRHRRKRQWRDSRCAGRTGRLRAAAPDPGIGRGAIGQQYADQARPPRRARAGDDVADRRGRRRQHASHPRRLHRRPRAALRGAGSPWRADLEGHAARSGHRTLSDLARGCAVVEMPPHRRPQSLLPATRLGRWRPPLRAVGAALFPASRGRSGHRRFHHLGPADRRHPRGRWRGAGIEPDARAVPRPTRPRLTLSAFGPPLPRSDLSRRATGCPGHGIAALEQSGRICPRLGGEDAVAVATLPQ